MTTKKKQPVGASQRREWLKFYEEEGKTPPQIAKGPPRYDVRTVRAQLELARQEREQKEANILILKDAKEKHYADLIDYARELAQDIQKESAYCKDDLRYVALKEHMPKSVLWRSLDKLDDLNQEITKVTSDLNEKVKESIETIGANELGLDADGLTGVLVHYARYPDIKLAYKKEKTATDSIELRYGAYRVADAVEASLDRAKEAADNIIKDQGSSEVGEMLINKYNEKKNLTAKISEELTTIIMRRLLPGSCKYCPF